jgi:hypothetical protein
MVPFEKCIGPFLVLGPSKLTRQFFVSFESHIGSFTRESHGLPMAEYRANFILVCSDDAEAIRLVQYFVGEFVIELWSGNRVVTRLEAKTK